MTPTRYAVIDIGSSTVKYAVYDWTESKPQIFHEAGGVATRLGRGLQPGAPLPAAGRELTLSTISKFARKISKAGATLSLIAATEAVRRASDREPFLDAVRKLVGPDVDVRCIDAETEARWALKSALGSLDLPQRPLLVIDPGGSSHDFACVGSTDLSEGENTWLSLPFGMNQLMDLASPTKESGRLTPSQVDELAEYLRRQYQELQLELGAVDRIVGTSGAILALATVDAELGPNNKQRRAQAVHGRRLSRTAIDNIIRFAGMMSADERRLAMPSLTAMRAPILVHGALIYRELLDIMGLDEITVNAWGMKLGGLIEINETPKN